MKENKDNTGSAVSTAVGEPVAWMQDDRMLCTTAESKKKMETAGFGKWAEIAKRYTIPLYLAAPTQTKPVDLSGLRQYHYNEFSKNIHADPCGEYFLVADVERLLAAPTQASAPQANELSISRQKLNMAKIDVLMDGARARGEEFRDGVTYGANSLHMKMLELAGAPQASAAQEVRAVPEDVSSALDRMCTPLDESRLSGATAAEDARCMEIIRRHIEGTSTAPAAMDEGDAK